MYTVRVDLSQYSRSEKKSLKKKKNQDYLLLLEYNFPISLVWMYQLSDIALHSARKKGLKKNKNFSCLGQVNFLFLDSSLEKVFAPSASPIPNYLINSLDNETPRKTWNKWGILF